jgi:hypothetical protein
MKVAPPAGFNGMPLDEYQRFPVLDQFMTVEDAPASSEQHIPFEDVFVCLEV